MVEEYIQNATQYDISVRGVWIQDWAGQIFTDFGDRVFWNWEWNETQYPALDQKIIEYGEKGTYFLNYLNPHLLNTNTSKGRYFLLSFIFEKVSISWYFSIFQR